SATVAPDFAVELGKRLAEKDLLLLDAPVSGGAARAASGEMTMMPSGPADVYAKIEDVLAGMAGKVYRLGDTHGIGS
ncbi:NAD(P)-binding domain-containing protein, partial [Acinetobacter baumannii]